MHSPDSCARLLPLILAMGLSACATLPSPTGALAPPGAAPSTAMPPSGPRASAAPAPAKRRFGAGTRRRPLRRPCPGHRRPFATVIKDAKKVEGVLTLWHKDEKLWIELRARRLRQAVLPEPEDRSGHRRAGRLRRLDGARHRWRRRRPAARRVPAPAQRWCSSWRATPTSPRSRTRPRHAPYRRRSRTACSAACRWRASRIRTRKSILIDANDDLRQRHARRRHAVAAHLPAGLRPRHAQLGGHARARHAGDFGDRGAEPLRRVEPVGAAGRLAARRPGADRAAHLARPAQPVRDAALLVVQAARGSRCARARPMRASATSTPWCRTSPTISRARRSCATSRAGACRRRTRRGDVRAGQADHLLARPHDPRQVPRRDHRGHPRVEQGLRAHRIQGRDRRQGSARRCRLRHARREPRVGALGDQQHGDLRRDRPQAHRSAQRRNTRCRHQHRERRPALDARAACADSRVEPARARCRTCRMPASAGAAQAHDHASARWPNMRPSNWATGSKCSPRATTSIRRAPRRSSSCSST